MDKSQKQKIVSYLKTIYQGVPVKRLFKRCERQLELCEKSLMESENIASLVVQKESFKRAQVPSIKGTCNNSSCAGRLAKGKQELIFANLLLEISGHKTLTVWFKSK